MGDEEIHVPKKRVHIAAFGPQSAVRLFKHIFQICGCVCRCNDGRLTSIYDVKRDGKFGKVNFGLRKIRPTSQAEISLS